MANTPKGQRTKQRRFGKWFRREPKGIDDFFRTEERIRNSRNQLTTEEARKRFLREVSRVRRMVDNTNGDGYHFIFPLTAAASTGEFIRGILKVIAPKARTTFLATGTLSGPIDEDVKRMLTPNSRHIRIVDLFQSGNVLRSIKNKLNAVAKKNGIDIQSIRPGKEFPLLPFDPVLKNQYMAERDRFQLGNFRSQFRYLGATQFDDAGYVHGEDPNQRFATRIHWRKTEGSPRAPNPRWAILPMDEAQYWKYVNKHEPENTLPAPANLKQITRNQSIYRKRLYQLGIAYGKEYLEAQKTKIRWQ